MIERFSRLQVPGAEKAMRGQLFNWRDCRPWAAVHSITLVTVFVLCISSQASVPYSDSDYLIESWETDQGLPENSATAMVQTPDGYLWFGTFSGLVRYDGQDFTVFDRLNTP